MATPEELILKQFAGARQKLSQKQKAAEDELNMGLQRRQAITGMTGGSAAKAAAKAQKQLAEGFGTAQAELEGAEADQLRQSKEIEEQRKYGTAEREAGQAFSAGQQAFQQQFQKGEREGSQGFAAEQAARQRAFAEAEAGKERGQQQSQFEAAFGLQGKQFDEQKRQFDQQLLYQLSELAENKITNLINAMTAFQKSGIDNPELFKKLKQTVGEARSWRF